MLKTSHLIALAVGTLLLVGGIFYLNSDGTSAPGEGLQSRLDHLEAYRTAVPGERVYAHFDKPQYAPGETVWFTAFVRDAADFSPSAQSNIARAELLSPSGDVVRAWQLLTDEQGIAEGDFQLDPAWNGGKYRLKFYTDYQLNEENAAIYERDITVQRVTLPDVKATLDFVRKGYGPGETVQAEYTLFDNTNRPLAKQSLTADLYAGGERIGSRSFTTDAEGYAVIDMPLPAELSAQDAQLNIRTDYRGRTQSLNRSVPLVLQEVDMQFYPEGGDMQHGLAGKVAFKSTRPDGLPADVQGDILNGDDEVVARFSSLHDGMGAFELTPERGETYRAVITHPVGIARTYELPAVQGVGIGVRLESQDDEALRLNIASTEGRRASLAVQVRGKEQYAASIKLRKGDNAITIPTNDMPAGVARITVFDERSRAVAERMALVNPDKTLRIQLDTDKDQYQPREQVALDVTVTDGDGNPVKTDLSLAVVDDQLLNYADDKSGNILTWMLMEADIDAEVHEPSFYFSDDARAADARDLVMMTSGWRRFDWEVMANSDMPTADILPSRRTVSARVYDANGKPLPNAKVMAANQPMLTDENGFFTLDNRLPDFRKGEMKISVAAPDHRRMELAVSSYGTHTIQLPDHYGQYGEVVENSINGAIAPTPTRTVAVSANNGFMANGQFQFVGSANRWTTFNAVAVVSANESNANNEVILNPNGFQSGVVTEVEDNRTVSLSDSDGIDDPIKEIEWANGSDIFSRVVQPDVAYYQVREFPQVKYKSTRVDARNDFRSTVFWDGHLQTDENGKAQVTFHNSDAVTSFNIAAEGMSAEGLIGRADKKFYTQLPFSISARIPAEVVAGDQILLPVTLTNNSEHTISGKLAVEVPSVFIGDANVPARISLAPGESKTFDMRYMVPESSTEGDTDFFKVAFDSGQFSDEVQHSVMVVPKGFPTRTAFSGTGMATTYEVDINRPVAGSLEVDLKAYPNALAMVLTGLDGMLRVPHGCFEQTTSTTYPNVLALQYARETEQMTAGLQKEALENIEAGYKRLKGFESKTGGFDWFGTEGGNLALSAYAVMHFTHMKEVWRGVEQPVIDRTIEWLSEQRNGKGGFTAPDERKSHSIFRKHEAIDAFIVYALSEASAEGFDMELAALRQRAERTDDPYIKGLAANALLNYGQEAPARAILTNLDYTAQPVERAETAFGSYGRGVQTEAAALHLMALTKLSDFDMEKGRQLAEYLHSQSNGSGMFGSTQSTVLAMRALTASARYLRSTQEDGTIAFYVEGRRVAEQTYIAGIEEPIIMDGLEQYFTSGLQSFEVRFEGIEYPLPHTVSVRYRTELPPSAEDQPIVMELDYARDQVAVGEPLRIDVKVQNRSRQPHTNPMAIVGVPAGLQVDTRQLDDLKRTGDIAYYELAGNDVVLYFRELDASSQRVLPIHTSAAFAGTFHAPASSSYLYYNDDEKYWTAGEAVTVVN